MFLLCICLGIHLLSKNQQAEKYNSYQINYINESIDFLEEVGSGRFSNIYKAKLENGTIVAAKKLKPIEDWRLKREISILTLLQKVPNVLHLYGVYGDSYSPIIVTDFIKVDKNTIPTYSDLQWAVKSILSVLNETHNMHIFHRDIKWQNVLCSFSDHQIRIIDWGLAEYVNPGKKYSYSVGTKSTKAPELLFRFPYYGTEVDIWASGCIMANLMFGTPSFFNGNSNEGILNKHARFFGKEIIKLAQKYNSKKMFPYFRRQSFWNMHFRTHDT